MITQVSHILIITITFGYAMHEHIFVTSVINLNCTDPITEAMFSNILNQGLNYFYIWD
jgi:hypothetical protein